MPESLLTYNRQVWCIKNDYILRKIQYQNYKSVCMATRTVLETSQYSMTTVLISVTLWKLGERMYCTMVTRRANINN